MWGTERRRAASEIRRKMGGYVYHQRIRSRMGLGGWVWIRWVGEHGELHTPDRHLRPLHQVLPVPSAAAAAQRHRHRRSRAGPPPPRAAAPPHEASSLNGECMGQT